MKVLLAAARARLAPLLRFLPALVALGLATAAFVVMKRELRHHSFRELRETVRGLPGIQVAQASLLTALSYLVLTGYDALALTALKIKLPYRRTMLASFLGYVFSNNVGLSVLGGGAARWRVYRGFGLSTLDVAKVVAFCAVSFWLGLLALAGAVLCFAPDLVAAPIGVPLPLARAAGVLLIAISSSYVLLCRWRREPLRWRRFELELPTARVAAAQIVVSLVDWTVAAAVLYVLLPVETRPPFLPFLGTFLAAQIVALASHVPGGIGVFELLMTTLLQPSQKAGVVLGALVAYRFLYYLLPLAVGMVVFALHELHRRVSAVERVTTLVARVAPALVPRVLAVSTFWAGSILLFSGATPPILERSLWLARAVPLGVIEISHFVGSLAGVGLFALALGLYRRIRFAWGATAVLLAAGVVASLLKGLDYEEASLLALLLLAHLPCRRHFTRRSSMLHAPLTTGWIVAVVIILASAAWLTVFSFRHVEYSSDLFWQFEFNQDAPRRLRAITGAAIVAFAFTLAHLLRPAQPVPPPPDEAALARAEPLIRRSPDSSAHLALVGDKALLFAEHERAFLMYAVRGRSWIALGDPVGARDAGDELAWRFHEMVHRHGGHTVFYQVLGERLPLYLDLGLALRKLGEEARVPLQGFALAGRARRNLRRACDGVVAAGGTFELVPTAAVPAILPELAAVSEAWLAARATREKGFSIGRFDAAYLARRPVGVVRHGGRIVAFANLWAGDESDAKAGATDEICPELCPEFCKEELSVDLIRHTDDAPDGSVDFLMTRLIEWGRDRGYAWFNLGMAPLSGLETRPLSTLWSRIAATVFQHGERLYNFQGVRRWKEKFDPVWRPRYLAAPGGLKLPSVLRDVTALVSGGVRGTFKK